MESFLQYPYSIGVIVIGLIWFTFYFLRKDLRRRQLIISLFTAPLAPISQVLWFSKDYWNPKYILSISINGVPVGIEEFLFSFFVGGIGSVLYEVLRRKKVVSGKRRSLIAFLIFLITASSFLLLKFIDLNTVWASSIALLFGSILMLLIDRDLLTDGIFSGFVFAVIAMVTYWVLFAFYNDLYSQFWIKNSLIGINAFKIPIEEIIWFFSWGIFSGVIYEFFVNVNSYRDLRNKN